jgi:predicted porin
MEEAEMEKVHRLSHSPGAVAAGLVTTAAVAAILVFPPAGPASAAEVSSGNDDITLTLSGQINRGVLYADDGAETAVLNVDNDNSSTRVRFVGVGRYNEDITVGTVFEVQFESNSSANIKIDGSDPGGVDHFTERKLEIYFDHARYGRIWLGQGDTASNGTSEVDLSGTSVINYSGIQDMAGGIQFGGFADPIDLTNNPSINTVYSNFDGLSRDDRIRYDTPNFGGFSLAASYADSRKSDIALRFAGDVGAGVKLAGAVAYAVNGDIDSQVNGSLSVLHSSGFNVTGAAGMRDLQPDAVNPTRDPFFWYAKLGYIWKGGIGDTAFAIDYAVAEEVQPNAAATGDEFTSYGIFVVQKVDKIATELYLGARNHELDRTGQNFDDIFAVLGGARVKF